MNLIIWLIVGGLVGWLASLIMSKGAPQNLLFNVVVGVFGAVCGGLISPIFNISLTSNGISIGSFLVSLIAAIVLLAFMNMFPHG